MSSFKFGSIVRCVHAGYSSVRSGEYGIVLAVGTNSINVQMACGGARNWFKKENFMLTVTRVVWATNNAVKKYGLEYGNTYEVAEKYNTDYFVVKTGRESVAYIPRSYFSNSAPSSDKITYWKFAPKSGAEYDAEHLTPNKIYQAEIVDNGTILIINDKNNKHWAYRYRFESSSKKDFDEQNEKKFEKESNLDEKQIKVNKKVVSVSNAPGLTIGKSYDVIEHSGRFAYITVKNDSGIVTDYKKEYFVNVMKSVRFNADVLFVPLTHGKVYDVVAIEGIGGKIYYKIFNDLGIAGTAESVFFDAVDENEKEKEEKVTPENEKTKFKDAKMKKNFPDASLVACGVYKVVGKSQYVGCYVLLNDKGNKIDVHLNHFDFVDDKIEDKKPVEKEKLIYGILNTSIPGLTKGSVYKLVKHDENKYTVKNNKDISSIFHASCFNIVTEPLYIVAIQKGDNIHPNESPKRYFTEENAQTAANDLSERTGESFVVLKMLSKTSVKKVSVEVKKL